MTLRTFSTGFGLFGAWGCAVAWMMAMCTGHASATVIAKWEFEQNLSDTGAAPALNLTGIGSVSYSTNTPTKSGASVPIGGNSLQLGATNSYAYNTPGDASKLERDSFTVEAWINPAALGSPTSIFAFEPVGAWHDARGSSLVLDSDGGVRVYLGPTDGSSFRSGVSTTKVAVGNWYHVAYSYDANSFTRLFVNGIQEYEGNLGLIDWSDIPAAGYGPQPKTLYLGIQHDASNTGPGLMWAYTGLIDQVIVHNTAFAAPGGTGTAAPQLDYYVPEPGSVSLLAIIALARSMSGRDRRFRRRAVTA